LSRAPTIDGSSAEAAKSSMEEINAELSQEKLGLTQTDRSGASLVP
jgi:hypothetical protein